MHLELNTARSSRRPVLRLASAVASLALWSAPLASQSLPPSDLSEHQIVRCQANQDVEIRGRSIDAPDVAIWVEGNCDVEIVDSHIRARNVAVRTMGNGDVSIRGSFVQGGRGAIVSDGNSEVEYQGSTLRGGTTADGSAEHSDSGGSYRERIPAGASGQLTAAEAIVCGDDDSVSVVGKVIESEGDAIVVEGSCEVLVSDSHIRAQGSAIVVRGEARVRVRNSTLDGRAAALTLEGGSAHVAGTNVRGGIDERGGRFSDGGGNAR